MRMRNCGPGERDEDGGKKQSQSHVNSGIRAHPRARRHYSTAVYGGIEAAAARLTPHAAWSQRRLQLPGASSIWIVAWQISKR